MTKNIEYNIFETRFLTVIKSLGGLKKCSDLVGVSDEQIAKWRDGKSRPPLFAVATLCEKAGKTIDWVVGLDKTVELDTTLLINCLQAAEEHLGERGEKLDAKNKAMLIASLYSIQLNEWQKKFEKQIELAEQTDKSVA